MKKTALYLGLLSAMFVMSCKEKEVVQTETVENNTETVRSEPSDTVVVKTVDEAPTGTAVKVDGDGISVDSKDVNVDVRK